MQDSYRYFMRLFDDPIVMGFNNDSDDNTWTTTVVFPQPKYNVAVYLEDRAYGGPEEGGWWYDCGELTDALPVKVFNTRIEAYAYANNLQVTKIAEMNEGRREISSVLSEGRYTAMIHPGETPPKFWPEERPHYE